LKIVYIPGTYDNSGAAIQKVTLMNDFVKITTSAWALLGGVLLCAAPGGAAHGQQLLDFTYTFLSGDVESGVLSGADAGNYFTVTSIPSLTVDGVDLTAATTSFTVESFDASQGLGLGYNGDGSAVVTIDGSYIDLFTLGPDGAAVFGVGDAFATELASIAELRTVVYSGQDTPFVAANWTASLQGAAVPESGSLGVMAGALGMLGMVVRRRRFNG
jgi:hypothetical protein